MNVFWSEKGTTSFNRIVGFLLENWNVEIAINFVDIVEHTIDLIVQNPQLFKISEYDNDSREAFITKHTTMFYRIHNKTIEVQYFWGNMDNPEKRNEINKL